MEEIFLDLTQKFGFQRDSMRNMVRVSSVGVKQEASASSQNTSPSF
jgi:hypothetical protein